jgi:hypothetical protein
MFRSDILVHRYFRPFQHIRNTLKYTKWLRQILKVSSHYCLSTSTCVNKCNSFSLNLHVYEMLLRVCRADALIRIYTLWVWAL